jgi:hypothetical protein
MRAAVTEESKLGTLGTTWALTQFGAPGAFYIKSCETGHQFQTGKEARGDDV